MSTQQQRTFTVHSRDGATAGGNTYSVAINTYSVAITMDEPRIDPDTGAEEICPITGQPASESFTSPSGESFHCVILQLPSCTVIELPCAHRFNGLALVYHWALNQMRCPLCIQGSPTPMSLGQFDGEHWTQDAQSCIDLRHEQAELELARRDDEMVNNVIMQELEQRFAWTRMYFPHTGISRDSDLSISRQRVTHTINRVQSTLNNIVTSLRDVRHGIQGTRPLLPEPLVMQPAELPHINPVFRLVIGTEHNSAAPESEAHQNGMVLCIQFFFRDEGFDVHRRPRVRATNVLSSFCTILPLKLFSADEDEQRFVYAAEARQLEQLSQHIQLLDPIHMMFRTMQCQVQDDAPRTSTTRQIWRSSKVFVDDIFSLPANTNYEMYDLQPDGTVHALEIEPEAQHHPSNTPSQAVNHHANTTVDSRRIKNIAVCIYRYPVPPS